MVSGERMHTAPMRLHGKKLADYAIERIDMGLELATSVGVEQSLGRAVLNGMMTAEEAYDRLEAYDEAFDRAFNTGS